MSEEHEIDLGSTVLVDDGGKPTSKAVKPQAHQSRLWSAKSLSNAVGDEQLGMLTYEN